MVDRVEAWSALRLRSSDQRYHDVRRVKRTVPEFNVQIVKALRDARLDSDALPALNAVIEESAEEFSHVLLACGVTANDFRRNFRHGSAGYHRIPANDLAELGLLQQERLDGYVVFRMTKDQTWNVKQRWAKLRRADRLIHDPQGRHWARILAATLDGRRDEHVGYLCDLRDRGISLVEQNAVTGTQDAVEHAARNMMRQLRSFSHSPPDWLNWDAAKEAKEARGAWFTIRERLRQGHEWYRVSAAEHRVEIEKMLVVCEAFLDGGNVRAAVWDPDTSQRHCSAARLRDRIDRVSLANNGVRQVSGSGLDQV